MDLLSRLSRFSRSTVFGPPNTRHTSHPTRSQTIFAAAAPQFSQNEAVSRPLSGLKPVAVWGSLVMASHPLLAELDGVHSFLEAAANSSASAAAVAAQHAAMLAKLRLAGNLPLLVAAELLTKAFRKIPVLLRFSDRCIPPPTCGSL